MRIPGDFNARRAKLNGPFWRVHFFESLRFRLRGKSGMQNNVITLCVALLLRIVRGCLKEAAGMFGFRRSYAGKFSLGAFWPSLDLDSARLDAVSRSLWWGSGVPIPDPVQTACSPPNAAGRTVRRHGGGPATFYRDA